MRKTLALICVTLLTIFSVTTVAGLVSEPVLSLPTLPQQYLETRFHAIQQGFEQRATLFLKGRPFQRWEMNRPRKNILIEFDQLNEWRFRTWYVDPNSKILISRMDFMVAQELLEKGLYKRPAFLAFDYNHTDGHYNASTVLLNGFKFLALESPTPQTLKHFFLLLQNHRVTQLVRLTGSTENTAELGTSYWNNKLKVNTQRNETILNIPQPYSASHYALQYYATDVWPENHGVAAGELLKLILKVRKNADQNGLIACHSTHGNGRTGTFIAGFLLINEIDRQIATGISKNAVDVSVEKIVMQLSLQRPYLVRKAEQYITLYRLLDLYVKNLK
ncbi:MAG TPA: protein-tyrosine phosphatase family protein [Gammaproteobacteria bacterium]|nr:protein-tyrosine phosphatase family protein [Gammaproteobacteria bacterium]HRA42924.1 protein-tyrosine phosphatase family protein [Gammaproteobacteria bacterium]